MDSLFGIQGKDFVIVAADCTSAYSILKYKVKKKKRKRKPPIFECSPNIFEYLFKIYSSLSKHKTIKLKKKKTFFLLFQG